MSTYNFQDRQVEIRGLENHIAASWMNYLDKLNQAACEARKQTLVVRPYDNVFFAIHVTAVFGKSSFIVKNCPESYFLAIFFRPAASRFALLEWLGMGHTAQFDAADKLRFGLKQAVYDPTCHVIGICYQKLWAFKSGSGVRLKELI